MRDMEIPAANANVEAADDAVFFLGEAAALDVRPQVIQPPQPATLPTSLQPYNTTSRTTPLAVSAIII